MAETILEGNTRSVAQKATATRRAHYASKWWWIGALAVAWTLLFAIKLGYVVKAWWTHCSQQTAGNVPGPTVYLPPRPQLRPPVIPPCDKNRGLPTGERGHFCPVLEGGVPSSRVKPPLGTYYNIVLDAPGGKIQYFNYNGVEIGYTETDGPEVNNCGIPGAYSFRVTLKEKGAVTVLISDHFVAIPGMAACTHDFTPVTRLK